MSTPQPVPPVPVIQPVVILTPGVPVTLQVSGNGVTYQLTLTLAVNSSGGLSISADSAKVTADSAAPIA